MRARIPTLVMLSVTLALALVSAASMFVALAQSNAAPAALVAQRAAAYPPPLDEIIDIGTLGGPRSYAYSTNDPGQVVGWSDTGGAVTTCVSMNDIITRAFLYNNGVITGLGVLSGTSSYAYDINDLGQIVGWVDVSGAVASRAFLYDGGAVTDLGTLGGTNSYAYGVNNARQVVGQADTPTGTQAFMWQNGGISALDIFGYVNSAAYGINNSGQVVGWVDTLTGTQHAFLWQEGEMSVLGASNGYVDSAAHGINDLGRAVGWVDTVTGTRRAFAWRGDGVTDLGTIPMYPGAAAYDINNLDQIVGTAITSTGTPHAVFYHRGTLFDLNSLLPEDSGWELVEARGINDAGQIVGYGTINGQTHAFVLTIVQESLLHLPLVLRY
jgi:probable HAF family extracellular repeat protein